MRSHRFAPVLLLVAVALVAYGGSGCSKSLKNILLPNERPYVRLTQAPIDTTHEEFYVYKMNWVGYDPDGRVNYYQYAIDPPSATGSDTAWTQTTKNEQIITFTASKPESLPDPAHPTRVPRGQSFHVFVIRAVDDRGMVSAPVSRAFFSFGVAPTVQIDQPIPNKLLAPTVTPAVQILWSGKDYIDPNGALFEKPVYYKFALFKKGDSYFKGDQNYPVKYDTWIATPDSLRAEFAPNFEHWDTATPDSAFVQYTNLTPRSEYLFAVVAFARSGAYSPVFSLDSNMLRMFVDYAGNLGPVITMFNSFFSYTYASGGFSTDPSRAVPLQVPAQQPLTFNWFAAPPTVGGPPIKQYRWVLDLSNLDDETPRSNQNDWYHWSPWSLSTSTATIGPFQGAGGDTGEVHNFFIEAEDINGFVSLGWVQFAVFKPTFDKDLLIVNDTRLGADNTIPSNFTPLPGTTKDSIRAPSGAWPNAAELDTFLFAVGGVHWRMEPAGRISPVGIFHGYKYDTLGTRNGREIPTTPLSLIGRYTHVIWMVDSDGSLNDPQYNGGGPTSPTFPMTTLRYMSVANRQNTLATWCNQGGKLWALGGGFANATNAPWNNNNNDVAAGGVRVYTTIGVRPDLGPGRFMYDITHWQSEFRELAGVTASQMLRYDQPEPFEPDPGSGLSKWPGYPLPNPIYEGLPTVLRLKDPSRDPIFPNRQFSDFYLKSMTFEYLYLENYITETVQVTPDSTTETSTLDTLYMAYNTSVPVMRRAGEGLNVIMSYYHGKDCGPMLFSGFPPWTLTRPDFQQMVDFVLGTLWGLPKSGALAQAAGARPVAIRPFKGTASPPAGTVRAPVAPAGSPTKAPTASPVPRRPGTLSSLRSR